MQERILKLSSPFSLAQTLGPIRHGQYDPCVRLSKTEFWRATRSPAGPVTTLIQPMGDEVRARAWGEGAQWALDQLPILIGENSRPEFDCEHEAIAELHRRRPGMRFPRTNAVFEAFVPSIIEQRVTGLEAKASYRHITKWLSEPAPGPVNNDLYLPVDPKVMAKTPAWAFHKFGLESKRANALRLAANNARRLEEATTMNREDAMKRLTALPGLGVWTAAEVAVPALGDTDAFSIGDYHLKNYVSWFLAGEARGTDERMVELLEPFRPHRGWVTRLIMSSGHMPPKFGPRYNPIPIASY